MATSSLPYDEPTRCTGGPAPGATALMGWLLAMFPGTHSDGIYSCRTVRVGQALSEHAEGRAVDVGVPTLDSPIGDKVAKLAVSMAGVLGVQTVIWNRQIWTSRNPTWRPYGPYGNPTLDHRDHVHIGLNRAAAGSLTSSRLAGVNTNGTGPAAKAGQVVAGVGSGPVDAVVNPLLDKLRQILVMAALLAGGAALVVAGGYRATTGRRITRDTATAAKTAAQAAAMA